MDQENRNAEPYSMQPPLRVGRILDDGLNLAIRAFSPRLLILLAGFGALNAFFSFLEIISGSYLQHAADGSPASGKDPLALVAIQVFGALAGALVQWILMVYSVVVFPLIAEQLWLTGRYTFKQAHRQVGLKMVLRTAGVNLGVMISLMLRFFISVSAGVLLFMLLSTAINPAIAFICTIPLSVVPPMLYLVRRSLAQYFVVLSGCKMWQSLVLSKLLMRQTPNEPWGHLRSPLWRISAILFLSYSLSFMSGIMLPVVQLGSQAGVLNMTLVFLALLAAHIIIYSVQLLHHIWLTGFFLDCRARSEGLDLFRRADALRRKHEQVDNSRLTTLHSVEEGYA